MSRSIASPSLDCTPRGCSQNRGLLCRAPAGGFSPRNSTLRIRALFLLLFLWHSRLRLKPDRDLRTNDRMTGTFSTLERRGPSLKSHVLPRKARQCKHGAASWGACVATPLRGPALRNPPTRLQASRRGQSGAGVEQAGSRTRGRGRGLLSLLRSRSGGPAGSGGRASGCARSPAQAPPLPTP